MADIYFTCPRCSQNLLIDEAGAGATVKCPVCAELLAVPASDQDSKQTQRMRLFEYPETTSPTKQSQSEDTAGKDR